MIVASAHVDDARVSIWVGGEENLLSESEARLTWDIGVGVERTENPPPWRRDRFTSLANADFIVQLICILLEGGEECRGGRWRSGWPEQKTSPCHGETGNTVRCTICSSSVQEPRLFLNVRYQWAWTAHTHSHTCCTQNNEGNTNPS